MVVVGWVDVRGWGLVDEAETANASRRRNANQSRSHSVGRVRNTRTTVREGVHEEKREWSVKTCNQGGGICCHLDGVQYVFKSRVVHVLQEATMLYASKKKRRKKKEKKAKSPPTPSL